MLSQESLVVKCIILCSTFPNTYRLSFVEIIFDHFKKKGRFRRNISSVLLILAILITTNSNICYYSNNVSSSIRQHKFLARLYEPNSTHLMLWPIQKIIVIIYSLRHRKYIRKRDMKNEARCIDEKEI